MPDWVRDAIAEWTSGAGVRDGRLFRSLGKGQIQMLLGHASLETTERYLGSRQEIRSAVNDHLGIPLSGRRRSRRTTQTGDGENAP